LRPTKATAPSVGQLRQVPSRGYRIRRADGVRRSRAPDAIALRDAAPAVLQAFVRLLQPNDKRRNRFLANPFDEREVDGHLKERGIDRDCREVCHFEFEHRSALRAPTKNGVTSLGFADILERWPVRLIALFVNGQECVTRSGRPPRRIAGQARVEVNVPAVGNGLARQAPRSSQRNNAPRRDHMASGSAEEFSPFASIDSFRFDQDGGCGLNGRLSDSLGASPYFLTCRERLNGTGCVLAIVEVEMKCFLQIAPPDEGCSRRWPIDFPTIRTETIAEKPAMILALPIRVNIFGRFHRRQTPSIGERLSLDTTKREASHNRHQHILNEFR
jgi:hypothetical protein